MMITNITHPVKNRKSESASFWHIERSKLAKYSKSNMARWMMWAVQTERQGYQSSSTQECKTNESKIGFEERMCSGLELKMATVTPQIFPLS